MAKATNKTKKSQKAKKAAASGRQPWTKDDLKMLKTLVKQNTPTRLIALKLKRTEGSVRNKAFQEGISLRPTNRSPRD
jgi:hypothetical protein